jgi:hypothetical protein
MAKYQYRVAGELKWCSTSGSAILAITNPVGSGKKLVLRSFEVTPLHNATASIAAAAPNLYHLARATVTDGIEVVPAPLDTSGTWPATQHVLVTPFYSSPGVPIRTVTPVKRLVPSTLAWLAAFRPYKWGAVLEPVHPFSGSVTEAITLRAGESMAMYAQTHVTSVPLRVSVILKVAGGKSHSATFYVNSLIQGQALFGIVNDAGSGATLYVQRVAIEEVGTLDSPYLQLVPLGSIQVEAQADPRSAVTVSAMDSTYPNPSNWLKVFADVPVFPFNMPVAAFSAGSAGSPQGLSYLSTKDFVGPIYRAFFPEVNPLGATTVEDTFGNARKMRGTDLGVARANITIREGETVGLVSGAETAVLTTAVGLSGWTSLYFSACIDVEPKMVPTLRLTGIVEHSEVCIMRAGTTTVVASAEDVTGEYAWQFDPGDVAAVDIAILSLGYQILRVRNLPLTLADVTVPIQQQVDRQYLNP